MQKCAFIGWNRLPTLRATEAFQETSHLLFYGLQTGEVKSPVPVEINLPFHEINPSKGVTLCCQSTLGCSNISWWDMGSGEQLGVAEKERDWARVNWGEAKSRGYWSCNMTYFTVRWTFLAEFAEIFQVLIIHISQILRKRGGWPLWLEALDSGCLASPPWGFPQKPNTGSTRPFHDPC